MNALPNRRRVPTAHPPPSTYTIAAPDAVPGAGRYRSSSNGRKPSTEANSTPWCARTPEANVEVGTPKSTSAMSATARRAGHSAVGMQDRAGERRRFIAAQEERCVGDVERRWESPERDLRRTLVVPRLLRLQIIAHRVADDPPEHLRLDVGRTDRVDPDPVRRQLACQRAGQHPDGRLRHAVHTGGWP